jgi:hypothetical protein
MATAAGINGQLHATDAANRRLATFSKKQLFKKMKFINGDKVLDASPTTDKKSIGSYVAHQLYVPEIGREAWWTANKKLVATSISVKRNNCCTDMKKAVMSKYSEKKPPE